MSDLETALKVIEQRRDEAATAAREWEEDNATTTAAIARVRADLCQELLDDIRTLPRQDGLHLARECFLNMLAEARRWDVDYDGDTDAAGRSVSYVTHFIEVDGFTFDQLPEALGIKPAYMQTMEDAIRCAIEEPSARAALAESEKP